MIGGRTNREVSWPDPGTCFKKHLPCVKIDPRLPDVARRYLGHIDPDCGVLPPDIFLNDDMVTSARDNRAGEDPHTLAGSDNAIKGRACGGLSNQCQRPIAERFCESHGVAIHGRHGRGRMGQSRRHIFRQYSTDTLLQWKRFRFLDGWHTADMRQGFLSGNHGIGLYMTGQKAEGHDQHKQCSDCFHPTLGEHAEKEFVPQPAAEGDSDEEGPEFPEIDRHSASLQ